MARKSDFLQNLYPGKHTGHTKCGYKPTFACLVKDHVGVMLPVMINRKSQTILVAQNALISPLCHRGDSCGAAK